MPNFIKGHVLLYVILLISATLYYTPNYTTAGVILHSALLPILLVIASSYYTLSYMMVFITPATISILHTTRITPRHHII